MLINEHKNYCPYLLKDSWIELVRFLCLKIHMNDFADATILSPSLEVDGFWHEFILDTKRYREFCHRACNKFIDHDPRGGQNRIKQVQRYYTTIDQYENVFGSPPSQYWPQLELAESTHPHRHHPVMNQEKSEIPIRIVVRDNANTDTLFTVQRSSKVEKILHIMADRVGVNPDDLRLLSSGGGILCPSDSFEDHEIADGDIIYVLRSQSGC